jgi:hypothetical protein
MVGLAARMSQPLAATVLVREQLALALNRLGRGDEAEAVLNDLLKERGPSSETYGILGRICKDRWRAALKEGDEILAAGLLDRAIDAYLKGFEADCRDDYPGINAVTLMEVRDPPDERRVKILPAVQFAVERRIRLGNPDYWTLASLLELSILALDEKQARETLPKAVSCVRESWEPRATVDNLQIIREARERRGTAPAWAKAIEDSLRKRASA